MLVKEIIFMVEEEKEGGYSASALGEAIFTEAESLAELKQNIKDALDCHYENDADKPKIVRLHIVKEEMFSYA